MIDLNGEKFASWGDVTMSDLEDYAETLSGYWGGFNYIKRETEFPVLEKIVGFAKKVVPPSWNVCHSVEQFAEKPGIMNVKISIGDPTDERYEGVQGVMDDTPTYRDRTHYAFVVVMNRKDINWLDTILHELAHVAVFRWDVVTVLRKHLNLIIE